MKHEVVLPVIVDGYHWHCNEDRMWNLNELHKALDLGTNDLPSQWKGKVRDCLDQDGNFHVAHGGTNPGMKERLLKDANLHVIKGVTFENGK